MDGLRDTGVDAMTTLQHEPILPKNAVVMSDEQFESLRLHVAVMGTDLERAMLRQIEALAISVVAWRRSNRAEWQMRLEVETEAREIQVRVRKARTVLSVPTSKLTKADLLKMIENALAELSDEVEVE